jgi:hypothetical protein
MTEQIENRPPFTPMGHTVVINALIQAQAAQVGGVKALAQILAELD